LPKANAQTTSDQDFQKRCTASGVLVCQGFDASSTFVYSSSQTNCVYPPSGSTKVLAVQDTSIKLSGASALRFDIPGNTGADMAGNYSTNFGTSRFGPGSKFYVQYAQRFDSNYTTIDWSSMNTSPKQSIIYDGNGMTCANLELTLVDYYATNIPYMYSECGNRSIRTSTTNITSFTTAVPYLYQQGSSTTSGYNCTYGKESHGTGNGVGCFYYPANTWITFYLEVFVGSFGQANSTIHGYVAINGGAYQQFLNVTNYTINNDASNSAFSRIMLSPYMTGKNSSISHPTAHTWLDELIVSSQPIAAPGGTTTVTPPTTTTPDPPTNVTVN
jgi:outer membrane lipoprotein-sorting protein